MSQLAALEAVDQAIDQAVQALGTEEAADATAIQNAITLLQNLQSSGGITDAQATPVITDLQAQLASIQAATAALSTARSSLTTAMAPSPAGSAPSGSTGTTGAPASGSSSPAPASAPAA